MNDMNEESPILEEDPVQDAKTQLIDSSNSPDLNETDDTKIESSQRPKRTSIGRLSAAELLGRVGSKLANKQKQKEKGTPTKANRSKSHSNVESVTSTPKSVSHISLLSTESEGVNGKRISRGGSPAVAKWSDKWLIPFEHGWRREIVYRNTQTKSTKQCDIYYYAPDNVKLRSIPMIVDYINRTKCDLTTDCFSFSKQQVYKEPFEIVRNAGQCNRSSTSTSASSSATSVQLNSDNHANISTSDSNKKSNKKKSVSSSNKNNLNDADNITKKGVEEDNERKKDGDDDEISSKNLSPDSKKLKKKIQSEKQSPDAKKMKSDHDTILKSSNVEEIANVKVDVDSIKMEVNNVEQIDIASDDVNDKKGRASRKRKVSESFVATLPLPPAKEKSTTKKRKTDPDESAKPKEAVSSCGSNNQTEKKNPVGRPRKKIKVDAEGDASEDAVEKSTKNETMGAKCEGLDISADDKLTTEDKVKEGHLQEPDISATGTTQDQTKKTKPVPESMETKSALLCTATKTTIDINNPKNTDSAASIIEKTTFIDGKQNDVTECKDKDKTTTCNAKPSSESNMKKSVVDSKVSAVRNAANLALRAYMDSVQRRGKDEDGDRTGKEVDGDGHADRKTSEDIRQIGHDEKHESVDNSNLKNVDNLTSSDLKPEPVDSINKSDDHPDIDADNKKHTNELDNKNDHLVTSSLPDTTKAVLGDISDVSEAVINERATTTTCAAITNNTLTSNNTAISSSTKTLKSLPLKKNDQIEKTRAPLDSNGLKNLICGPSCAGRSMPPSVRCDVCMNLFHPECLGMSFNNVKNSMVCWGCQSYARENENIEHPFVRSEEELNKNKCTAASSEDTNGSEQQVNNTSTDNFEDLDEGGDDADKVETQVLVINPAITRSLNIKKEFLLKVQDKTINVPPENIYVTKSGVNVKLFDNPLPPEYISGLNNPLKFLVGSIGGIQVLNVSLLNGPL